MLPIMTLNIPSPMSFADRLQRGDRLEVEQAVRWCEQLLVALVQQHNASNPRVYGTLRPEQIIIGSDGNAQIIELTSGIASPGATDPYTALECVYAVSPLRDKRSDLYSLAALLYHGLSGKAPVNAQHRHEAHDRGTTDPLPPIQQVRPDLPAPLGQLLTRAMAIYPHERFASAEAMLEELRKITKRPIPWHPYLIASAVVVVGIISLWVVIPCIPGFKTCPTPPPTPTAVAGATTPTAAPSAPTSSPPATPSAPTSGPTAAPSAPTSGPTAAPSAPTSGPTAAPTLPTIPPIAANEVVIFAPLSQSGTGAGRARQILAALEFAASEQQQQLNGTGLRV